MHTQHSASVAPRGAPRADSTPIVPGRRATRVRARGAVRLSAVAALVAGLASVAAPARAADTLKSGAEVYQAVCSACHAAGINKAPRFGDRKAWAPLLKEPQWQLTAHGWVGVRGMPAKGGKADLQLEEFARAVVFMAHAAGGNWNDPDAAMMAKIRAEEQRRIAALAKKGK